MALPHGCRLKQGSARCPWRGGLLCFLLNWFHTEASLCLPASGQLFPLETQLWDLSFIFCVVGNLVPFRVFLRFLCLEGGRGRWGLELIRILPGPASRLPCQGRHCSVCSPRNASLTRSWVHRAAPRGGVKPPAQGREQLQTADLASLHAPRALPPISATGVALPFPLESTPLHTCATARSSFWAVALSPLKSPGAQPASPPEQVGLCLSEPFLDGPDPIFSRPRTATQQRGHVPQLRHQEPETS